MTCQINIDLNDGDGVVAAFYKFRIVKARKQHECVECRKPILVGQEYEKVTGKWDGDIDTVRTCSVCLEVRKEFFCSWIHGSMWADFEYEAEEEDFDLSHLNKLSKAAIDAISEHL